MQLRRRSRFGRGEPVLTPPSRQPEEPEGKGGIVLSAWPRLLSVEMAARYLGLSPKTIRNHKYKLPGLRKWGSLIVFDRHAIDRMLDYSGGRRSLWVDAEKLCR